MKLCENVENGNIFNPWKFQVPIYYRTQKNNGSPFLSQTDRGMDGQYCTSSTDLSTLALSLEEEEFFKKFFLLGGGVVIFF